MLPEAAPSDAAAGAPTTVALGQAHHPPLSLTPSAPPPTRRHAVASASPPPLQTRTLRPLTALLVTADSTYCTVSLATTFAVAAGLFVTTVTTLAAAPEKLPPAAMTYSLPLFLSPLLPFNRYLGSCQLDIRGRWCIAVWSSGCGGLAELL